MPLHVDVGNHWADQWEDRKLQRDYGGDISGWGVIYWGHSAEKERVYGKIHYGKN